MGRPRNEELYSTLKRNAYQQFMRNGYAETTYQSVADASDSYRTIVQNYFPSKKDLLMTFFEDMMASVHKAVRDEGFHQENDFDLFYCIGVSSFAFLLKDASAKHFLQEFIASRDLSEETLDFEVQWGMRLLEPPRSVAETQLEEDIMVAMGGFYTLLYKYLKQGRPFDLGTHFGKIICVTMQDYGYSYEEAQTFVKTHCMTDDEIKLIVDKVSEDLGL